MPCAPLMRRRLTDERCDAILACDSVFRLPVCQRSYKTSVWVWVKGREGPSGLQTEQKCPFPTISPKFFWEKNMQLCVRFEMSWMKWNRVPVIRNTEVKDAMKVLSKRLCLMPLRCLLKDHFSMWTDMKGNFLQKFLNIIKKSFPGRFC